MKHFLELMWAKITGVFHHDSVEVKEDAAKLIDDLVDKLPADANKALHAGLTVLHKVAVAVEADAQVAAVTLDEETRALVQAVTPTLKNLFGDL